MPALNIRDREVHELARQLAARTGETMTEAVRKGIGRTSAASGDPFHERGRASGDVGSSSRRRGSVAGSSTILGAMTRSWATMSTGILIDGRGQLGGHRHLDWGGGSSRYVSCIAAAQRPQISMVSVIEVAAVSLARLRMSFADVLTFLGDARDRPCLRRRAPDALGR